MQRCAALESEVTMSVTTENNVTETEVKTQAKTNLFGLDRAGMADYFVSIGEKPFRAQQIMKWIYNEMVLDFDSMTNLSKDLRAKLKDIAVVAAPEQITVQNSKDGTRKWLLRVDGNNAIETVFIPTDSRGTLCVSSQVGCTLDCTFCSTAQQGFNRNLSAGEIVGQLWYANKTLKDEGFNEQSRKKIISNVVMMGMGEPLSNYDNVVCAMRIMLDDFGFGLSKRRVTLSTSGIVPRIDKLREDCSVVLAVSLHAPNDALRDQLVPINKRHPIAELLAACERYLEVQPNNSRITWEYVMIDGVNDQDEHAHELAALLKHIPSKINLIPFNPFPGTEFKRSKPDRIERFGRILYKKGYTATVRRTRGDDIDAACGQLAGKVMDKTKRTDAGQARLAERRSARPLKPMHVASRASTRPAARPDS